MAARRFAGSARPVGAYPLCPKSYGCGARCRRIVDRDRMAGVSQSRLRCPAGGPAAAAGRGWAQPLRASVHACFGVRLSDGGAECGGCTWGHHTMKKAKSILVTGGAGFLGSHLCERLLQDGHGVLCVDDFSTGSEKNIAHLQTSPRFRWLRHDVTQPLAAEVDEIYNLACPASPVHYQADPVRRPCFSITGASMACARRWCGCSIPMAPACARTMAGWSPTSSCRHCAALT